MSTDKLVSKSDLQEFYNRILPYLGGSAEAGFTPVGTVISVMGKTAPANYLACDGSVYNIADYQELADYFLQQFESVNYFGGDGTTTFAVPDLQGEFLRGAGTNSHENQGSGGEVGEHQDSTEVLAMWSNNAKQLRIRLESTSLSTVLNEDATTIRQTSQEYLPSTTAQASESSYQGVRPTNTSVLFCIATKNIYLNPSLDYSTSEKVVGTWLGKPLYQRTIHFPKTALASGRNQLSHNIANVDIAWLDNTSFFHESTFNETFIVGSENSDTAFQVTWLLVSQTIVDVTISESMYNRLTSSSNDGIFATIQYTKTTD